MEDFNLIDILRTYCETASIYFIPGTSAYINAVADETVYENNELLLIADFTISPVIVNGRVSETSYTGVMSLGRKREESETSPSIETESSLDETYEQKYDRRLKELSSLLVYIISKVGCENDFDILNVTLRYDINQFDLNADFVAATLTLKK